MGVKCDIIVFHCMDPRLYGKIKEWMNDQGFACEYFDRVSIAGSTMDLVHGPHQVREFLLKQLVAARQLHSINHVLLFHHSDCGAYSMTCNHSSLEEERACQLHDMHKAEIIIRSEFPDLDVTKVWITINNQSHAVESFEVV
ncbi:MAG: hypothetical protein HQL02_05555 [Nitrospirae bacterium]|nr:hypothetical protein [Nitrospirota bacterium]